MRINFKVVFLFASMLTIESMNFEVSVGRIGDSLCARTGEIIQHVYQLQTNDGNVSVNTLAYV